jgi:uncharacterized protein DUF3592
VEIAFLLVGLFLAALGVAIVVSEARARSGAWTVPGEVIGFSTGKSRASGSASYYPVAQYVGVDGLQRYVEGSVGSSSPLVAVGDAVTVLVHPDPEKALIKSALSYLIGAVLAVMGLVSCIVFFAVFRASTLSIAGAVGVVTWAAFKLRRSMRDKPLSVEAWRKYKDEALRPRVFTEANKAEIQWAELAALQNAVAAQRKANRFAVPILLLGGVGLLFLGAHLYRNTATFLERAIWVPGVVVQMATNHSSNGNTYAPVVEFQHEGKKYRFKDSISSNPPSYRTGEAVGVLCDPANPRDARIDRGSWNKALPLLIGAGGAVLLVLGFWALKRQTAGASDRMSVPSGVPGS